ncbi:MAG: hypothetical protein KTR24_02340 [Saprospiraceae bacterium]|nr:hypothetical protein [Saprospiraceae bacterium]
MSIQEEWWTDIQKSMTSDELDQANWLITKGVSMSPFVDYREEIDALSQVLPSIEQFELGGICTADSDADQRLESALSFGLTTLYCSSPAVLKLPLQALPDRIVMPHGMVQQEEFMSHLGDRLYIACHNKKDLESLANPNGQFALVVSSSSDPVEELLRAWSMVSALVNLFDCQVVEVVLPLDDRFAINLCKIRALRMVVEQWISTSVRPKIRIAAMVPVLPEIHQSLIRYTAMAVASVCAGIHCLYLPISSNPISAIHQVLRHEAKLENLRDPAAGSFYYDALTSKLVKECAHRIQSMTP